MGARRTTAIGVTSVAAVVARRRIPGFPPPGAGIRAGKGLCTVGEALPAQVMVRVTINASTDVFVL